MNQSMMHVCAWVCALLAVTWVLWPWYALAFIMVCSLMVGTVVVCGVVMHRIVAWMGR